MTPRLAVVILNWNGATDTLKCMESVRTSTVPVSVVIVDNGSTDDSRERIRAAAPDRFVALGENLGYAGGNNAGIEVALSVGYETIAVLNNDTTVAPTAFERLLRELPAGEHRAVAPTIKYLDRPEISWFAGGTIERGWPRHLQPGELAHDARLLRPTSWLTGCCIVARRETWQLVGPLDPSYFLIFEDAAWSLRATRAGVALYVVTPAVIHHKVSSSIGRSAATSRLSSFYYVRNGLRLHAEHFPRYVARFAFAWLVRQAPALIQSGRADELAFRWFGAAAFVGARRGRAPRALERLASRTRRDRHAQRAVM